MVFEKNCDSIDRYFTTDITDLEGANKIIGNDYSPLIERTLQCEDSQPGDLGQCNDSNGAVQIALALSEATGIAVNDLPVSVILSWMEQKAVIVLLALFSLGLKSVHLGPKPPQFVNEDIFNFLAETFDFSLTTNAPDDLKKLLGQ